MILKKIVFLLLCSVLHAKPTICLNMIVKDECDVIRDCLKSVKGLIDYWVIFDTGSTDGTQAIIQEFMKDIPGELHQSTWIHFEHNRNEALSAAKDKADYLLIIDADEILTFSEGFSLPDLDKDYYTVLLRQSGETRRITFISTKLNWKWEGILHEHLSCDEIKDSAHLEGIQNISSSARGARSKVPDEIKYFKDAMVLEEALKKDPSNSRYVYYLGVSYLASGHYEQAAKNFKQRINMFSSDVEETYWAMYNLGVAQQSMGNSNAALKTLLRAHQFRPIRAEPILQAAMICRKAGNTLLGYLLCKYALEIPYPKQESSIDYKVYEQYLLIEFANCSLLLQKYEEGFEACKKLLNQPNLEKEYLEKVKANYKLAKENLHN